MRQGLPVAYGSWTRAFVGVPVQFATGVGHVYRFYAGVFHEWPPLILVNLTVVLAEVAYFMVFGTLPLYLTQDLGATPHAVGLVFSTFAIAETLGKTPAGLLSDRWGRLRVVLIGLALCAVTPLLMSVTPRWEPFVLLRVIDGVGLAAVWPVLLALISLRICSKSRATALSTFNLAYLAGMGLGWMAGLEIGERLGDNRGVFHASSIVFGLAILSLGALIFVDRRSRHCYSAVARTKASIWEDLREVARGGRPLLNMLWIFALMQLAITMLAPVLPLYARDEMGLSQHGMVRLLLVPLVVVAALAVPLGRLADWIGRERAVILGVGIAALALLSVALLQEQWQKQTAMAVIACCYAIAAPAWLAIATDLAPPGLRGAAMGAMNTAQGMGFVAGPLVGTFLYAHKSHGAPFSGAAIVLLVACLAIVLLVRAPAQTRTRNGDGASLPRR